MEKNMSKTWSSRIQGSRRWRSLTDAISLWLCAFLSFASCKATGSISTDIESLMAFKSGADNDGVLTESWVGSDSNPCGDERTDPWLGIKCNSRGRVVQISLTNLRLSGFFLENTLSRLNDLKNLVLTNNSFQGSIPNDLSEVTGLLQFWAHNAGFAGPVPKFLLGCRKLAKVDLSKNDFIGSIPDLSSLQALIFLNLSENSLSGSIPLFPPNLTVLDLSYNHLSGDIPSELVNNIISASFIGNSELCGPPLSSACPQAQTTSEVFNQTATSPSPSPPSLNYTEGAARHVHRGLSKTNMVLIIVVDALALIFILLALALCYYRKYKREMVKRMEKKLSTTIQYGNWHKQLALTTSLALPDLERSKLVFFEKERCRYDLEDLLQASAEMLGKGSFGTMYKAVLENGITVAVKRLKDTKKMGKEAFENYMLPLGKAYHPNLLPLVAYYYKNEEKLLVYDFMPGGSLFAALHGNRSLGPSPLDWDSRLHIAEGVASGLVYLHTDVNMSMLPHGNLRSSNILLGMNNTDVRISEFGLFSCMVDVLAAQRMEGYRAPESSNSSHAGGHLPLTADVFCFGLLLLELVTGRQPTNEKNEEGKEEKNPNSKPRDLPRWVQTAINAKSIDDVLDVELRNRPAPSSGVHGNQRQNPTAKDFAPCGITEMQQMLDLLNIAVSCLTPDPSFRPDMTSVAAQIQAIRGSAPRQPADEATAASHGAAGSWIGTEAGRESASDLDQDLFSATDLELALSAESNGKEWDEVSSFVN